MGASLAGVALACGLALRLFGPLVAAADFLRPVLGAAAEAVGRIAARALAFWFTPRSLRGAGLDAAPAGGAGPVLPSPGGGLSAARIAGLALLVLVGLLGVVLAGMLLLQLARWLLRRLGGRFAGGRASRLRLGGLLEALLRLPAHLWRGLCAWLRSSDRAATVYGALLRWGARSGLPRALSETPAEYGARAARSFPLLAREIQLIVAGYNLEAYGRRPPSAESLSRLRAARRRLLAPRHWPARLRVLLQTGGA